MKCQSCGSTRTAAIQGKCSDCCYACVLGAEHNGYVPEDMNVGGGDYLAVEFCMDCGQMSGTWPLEKTELEMKASEAERCPSCRTKLSSTSLDDGFCAVCGEKLS